MRTEQGRARPSTCTKSAIVKSVQASGRPVYLGVGHVRKNLRALMAGEQIVIVGNSWHARALLIPLSSQRYLDRAGRSAKLARMEKAAEEAFALVGD